LLSSLARLSLAVAEIRKGYDTIRGHQSFRPHDQFRNPYSPRHDIVEVE